MSREDRASWFGTDRHDEECEDYIGYSKGKMIENGCGCEDRADILEATRAQDIFGAINTQLRKQNPYGGGGNGA